MFEFHAPELSSAIRTLGGTPAVEMPAKRSVSAALTPRAAIAAKSASAGKSVLVNVLMIVAFLSCVPVFPAPGQQLVPATTFRLTPWCVITLRPLPAESEKPASPSPVVFAQTQFPLHPAQPPLPT